jgi:CubicO group peptidase (beta-lactamase class C family)
MTIRWSLGALAAAALAVGLAAVEPEPMPRAAPEAVGLEPAALTEATDLLRQFVADRKIAGAVAGVARHGKVAYLEAVGVQDLASREPMTERSIFRIYSMAKSVTAVAAMILHEEGKFDLREIPARVPAGAGRRRAGWRGAAAAA